MNRSVREGGGFRVVRDHEDGLAQAVSRLETVVTGTRLTVGT